MLDLHPLSVVFSVDPSEAHEIKAMLANLELREQIIAQKRPAAKKPATKKQRATEYYCVACGFAHERSKEHYCNPCGFTHSLLQPVRFSASTDLWFWRNTMATTRGSLHTQLTPALARPTALREMARLRREMPK